ncbi:MAG: N-6 DNA methylase, partial [Chloroflexota bacterium]|nr:N-6 DNA methylase [Chloroflexota bacterium]
MTTQESAFAEVERLVKSFKDMPTAQRKGLNEMQTRLGYILPLFKALGWDTSNINEVSPEEKVSRGWVDFSFRIGNVPRFFLETKKVNENLNDPRWVKQAIDYAWTKSVTWALLSDFEGLRVFNAEWKESNPFSAQFFELNLDTYLTEFDRLWWLSKEETIKRRLDLEAEKVGKKVKRQPVSQILFADLKSWRTNLFKNYKAFNLGYSAAQIDEAVLRLLNRLIFIRTAEDREVEDNRLRTLVRVLKDKKQINHLDRELAALFRQFDDTYNSELFARHFSEELQIPPTDLEEIIEGLYEKNFTRYNFNALDADVLGTAYEQYLGHVVVDSSMLLSADTETHVQEKRTKRKSQGIYYTPTFVTKYIVQQTVGRYLDEHGYNPSHPPRVLDMACGSGSFLIEAFDVIDRYVMNLRGQSRVQTSEVSE